MTKINPKNYFTGLVEKDGVFYSENKSVISYPESGNAFCLQIEDTSYWFRHRNNCILESVKKYCPEKIILDIGGGNGFVTKALEESGIESILVEPSETGCLNAKTRGVTTIVCASLEESNYKPNSVPAIGLFDVIEHIEDDQRFLQLVNKSLQVNGSLFITVPAFNTIWSAADDKAGHFRRYTLFTINKKLKKAGFRIEYSTYFFSVLPPFIFLFRTLLRKNKSDDNFVIKKTAHKTKKGIAGKLLDKIWHLEIQCIKNGRKIPFGGSCFIVARKNAS